LPARAVRRGSESFCCSVAPYAALEKLSTWVLRAGLRTSHSSSLSPCIRKSDYSWTSYPGATPQTLRYNLPHSSPVWPLNLNPFQLIILFLSLGAIVAMDVLIVVRTLRARAATAGADAAEPRALELVWMTLPAALLLLLLGYAIANLPWIADGFVR
jgi:hypothetical protein